MKKLLTVSLLSVALAVPALAGEGYRVAYVKFCYQGSKGRYVFLAFEIAHRYESSIRFGGRDRRHCAYRMPKPFLRDYSTNVKDQLGIVWQAKPVEDLFS